MKINTKVPSTMMMMMMKKVGSYFSLDGPGFPLTRRGSTRVPDAMGGGFMLEDKRKISYVSGRVGRPRNESSNGGAHLL